MYSRKKAFGSVVPTWCITICLVCACGGGGGKSADAQGSATGASSGGSTAAAGAIPPREGVFGGGSGKILFLQSLCGEIMEFDLSTRSFSRYVTPTKTTESYYPGGVSMAPNGRFAVIELPERSSTLHRLYILNPGGAISATAEVKPPFGTLTRGPAISPDGEKVAWTERVIISKNDGYFGKKYRRLYWFDGSSIRYITQGLVEDNWESDGIAGDLVWLDSDTLLNLSSRGFFKYQVSKLVESEEFQEGERIGTDVAGDPINSTLSPTKDAVWYSDVTTFPNGSIFRFDLKTNTTAEALKGTTSIGQQFGAFSPDGQWIGFMQADGNKEYPNLVGTYVLSAMGLGELPMDTANLDVNILGPQGQVYGPCLFKRYAWY